MMEAMGRCTTKFPFFILTNFQYIQANSQSANWQVFRPKANQILPVAGKLLLTISRRLISCTSLSVSSRNDG